MSRTKQPSLMPTATTSDLGAGAPLADPGAGAPLDLRGTGDAAEETAVAEGAARSALRAQIGRLERELSQLVADCFPDLSPVCDPARARRAPRLLGLAELERERDALVAHLADARAAAEARERRHREGRELLAAMQLEPARYKFVKLRAVDVGERGCGVWEVRPRLGLLGMLAGWWRVKLSSGCPLARGRAMTARPWRWPGDERRM